MCKATEKFLLPAEFADYATVNGFQQVHGQHSTYFTHPLCAFEVKDDEVIFSQLDEGEENQRSPKFEEVFRFKGISQLTTFNWMMLLHITGMVKFSQFIKRVSASNTSLEAIVEQLNEVV